MPKGWEEEKMLMKLSYLEKKLKEGPRKSAFSGAKAPKEKNISCHFAWNYVCFLMKICILFLGWLLQSSTSAEFGPNSTRYFGINSAQMLMMIVNTYSIGLKKIFCIYVGL